MHPLKTTLTALIAALLTACYSPEAPTPEPLKPKETKRWTNTQIDTHVSTKLISIPASEPAPQGAPQHCNNINFLRIKHQQGPHNPEQADAVFLIVPGVLEGANAFEYMGRQMVYMAHQHYNRYVEIWGMDRRSNCLEDLTGVQAGEAAPDIDTGLDAVVGYYYENQPIDGKTFAGFRRGADMDFLSEFGMRQTTLDMKAIIDAMMPTPGASRRNLFVGGHSLGGLHTSLFLAWDFDGDPGTTGDAGHELVAGAFGLDTQVTPTDQGFFLSDNRPATQLLKRAGLPSIKRATPEAMEEEPEQARKERFARQLQQLRDGGIARNVDFPGVFTPEILALPEFVALAASKAPDVNSRLLERVPRSLALQTMTRFIHSRYIAGIFSKPWLEDFNYTNKAYVGLIFDDDYMPLGFLQTGLGFLEGGPVARKWQSLDLARIIPGVDSLLQSLLGEGQQFIAADAGPSLEQLGQGPLYGWADRDQLGDLADPEYRDTSNTRLFTSLQDEPVDMDDFIRALYIGDTNLTEWYFPMRILLDMQITHEPFAPEFGLDLWHPQGVANVDSIVFNAGQGVGPPSGNNDDNPVPRQTRVLLPGYSHLDPMFEAVNSPNLTSRVMVPLLEFAFARVSPEP